MVEALDGALAAPHDGGNFGVGHVLHVLQDQKLLAFRRQFANDLDQPLDFLILLEIGFREILSMGQVAVIFERDFLSAAVVTVPVCHQIVGNPV